MSKTMVCANCRRLTTQEESDDRNFNTGFCGHCGGSLEEFKPRGRVTMPEEIDLDVAKKLREYNEMNYRVGEKDSDYLDGVYEIYDILRAAGAQL